MAEKINRIITKRILLNLAFILFFLFSFSGEARFAYSQDLWKVVKISDGDTIWVKRAGQRKIKIRVWGIDTPEKYRSKKLEREAARCGVSEREMRKLGILASKHAKELFDEKGRMVSVEFRGRGYYGRYLGIIYFADGTDYGEKMILDGYACVYRRSTKEEYRKAQERAKKERRGLWELNYSLMKCLCR